MPPFAYFEIESTGLTLAIDLLILFAVVLYGSLVYWTYSDARRRIEDPMLIGCATAAALFPFVGTLVYMILRPPEYVSDARERELEMHAAEARLHEIEDSLCPHCDYRIERDFIRCPSCLRKLKERCASCSKPLDREWTICPYCETEVPQERQQQRRSKRRVGSLAEDRVERRAEDRVERRAEDVLIERGAASARTARSKRSRTGSLETEETAVALEPDTAALEPETAAAARTRAAVRAPEPATRRKGTNEPNPDPGQA